MNLVPGFTTRQNRIYVYDMQTGALEVASVSASGGPANGYSSLARLSADGRYVVFQSDASDLVAGDLNRATDIFVRDRLLGVTELVSVGALGQGNGSSRDPSISADGRFVAFATSATNLAPGVTQPGHTIPVPANVTGDVTLQALLFDPTVPLGLRATNGVEVQIR